MDLQVDYTARDLNFVLHIIYVQKQLLLQQRVLEHKLGSLNTFCASLCSERKGKALTKYQNRNQKT